MYKKAGSLKLRVKKPRQVRKQERATAFGVLHIGLERSRAKFAWCGFFWSRIGIVKARGCHLEFWFWLGIARIQDLSMTFSCVFGSGASDWEYVAGGVDSETLHRDSSRCFGGTFGGLCRATALFGSALGLFSGLGHFGCILK